MEYIIPLHEKVHRVLDTIRESVPAPNLSARVLTTYIGMLRMSEEMTKSGIDIHVIKDKKQVEIATELGMTLEMFLNTLKLMQKCKLITVQKAKGRARLANVPDIYILRHMR